MAAIKRAALFFGCLFAIIFGVAASTKASLPLDYEAALSSPVTRFGNRIPLGGRALVLHTPSSMRSYQEVAWPTPGCILAVNELRGVFQAPTNEVAIELAEKMILPLLRYDQAQHSIAALTRRAVAEWHVMPTVAVDRLFAVQTLIVACNYQIVPEHAQRE